jgi:hypothetical protein
MAQSLTQLILPVPALLLVLPALPELFKSRAHLLIRAMSLNDLELVETP